MRSVGCLWPVQTLLSQKLFQNKPSGDKLPVGVGLWPLTPSYLLATSDGSDEMTTKIEPPVRTCGEGRRLLLDPPNMIRGRQRPCLIRAVSGWCEGGGFAPLHIVSGPQISPRVTRFNTILHLPPAQAHLIGTRQISHIPFQTALNDFICSGV